MSSDEAPGFSGETGLAAAELLRALGHPLRIGIITALAGAPQCVHELVDALGVSQVLVSQHLRVLRGVGTVRGDRRGKEVVYRLVDPHVGHIVGDAVAHAREGLRPAPTDLEPEPADPISHTPSDPPTERH